MSKAREDSDEREGHCQVEEKGVDCKQDPTESRCKKNGPQFREDSGKRKEHGSHKQDLIKTDKKTSCL